MPLRQAGYQTAHQLHRRSRAQAVLPKAGRWQEENLERRDELVRVMGINLDWRMNECSDGQRKKVRTSSEALSRAATRAATSNTALTRSRHPRHTLIHLGADHDQVIEALQAVPDR